MSLRSKPAGRHLWALAVLAGFCATSAAKVDAGVAPNGIVDAGGDALPPEADGFVPSEDSIRGFYATHPELFSDRRIYTLYEVTVPVPDPADRQQLIDKLKPARSVTQMRHEIEKSNLPFASSLPFVKKAEELPMALLPSLQRVEEKEALFISAQDGLKILFIDKLEHAPMSLDVSRDLIARYLRAMHIKQLNGTP